MAHRNQKLEGRKKKNAERRARYNRKTTYVKEAEERKEKGLPPPEPEKKEPKAKKPAKKKKLEVKKKVGGWKELSRGVMKYAYENKLTIDGGPMKLAAAIYKKVKYGDVGSVVEHLEVIAPQYLDYDTGELISTVPQLEDDREQQLLEELEKFLLLYSTSDGWWKLKEVMQVLYTLPEYMELGATVDFWDDSGRIVHNVDSFDGFDRKIWAHLTEQINKSKSPTKPKSSDVTQAFHHFSTDKADGRLILNWEIIGADLPGLSAADVERTAVPPPGIFDEEEEAERQEALAKQQLSGDLRIRQIEAQAKIEESKAKAEQARAEQLKTLTQLQQSGVISKEQLGETLKKLYS